MTVPQVRNGTQLHNKKWCKVRGLGRNRCSAILQLRNYAILKLDY
jgi:hypothetical protein